MLYVVPLCREKSIIALSGSMNIKSTSMLSYNLGSIMIHLVIKIVNDCHFSQSTRKYKISH